MLAESDRITYEEASLLSEGTLLRWLCWASRYDPSGPRILQECQGGEKDKLLQGLVWIGAIT